VNGKEANFVTWSGDAKWALTWSGPVRSDPGGIHDLRHTALSLRIAGDTSVVVVLDRYGHLYPEQDDELMELLERRAKRR
jgi:hypothetical protein